MHKKRTETDSPVKRANKLPIYQKKLPISEARSWIGKDGRVYGKSYDDLLKEIGKDPKKIKKSLGVLLGEEES